MTNDTSLNNLNIHNIQQGDLIQIDAAFDFRPIMLVTGICTVAIRRVDHIAVDFQFVWDGVQHEDTWQMKTINERWDGFVSRPQ